MPVVAIDAMSSGVGIRSFIDIILSVTGLRESKRVFVVAVGKVV
jgi:hypothetical protein